MLIRDHEEFDMQASEISRDDMLANIHFFRVRDYTEQASSFVQQIFF